MDTAGSLRGEAFRSANSREQDDCVFRTDCFAPAALEGTGLSADDVTAAEVHGPTLPQLLSAFVIRHSAKSLASVAIASRVGSKGSNNDTATPTQVSLGIGKHRFHYRGHELWALQQAVGPPVGTGCGAAQYETLVIVAKGRGRVEVLRELCDHLIRESEMGSAGTFTIFRWDVHSQCWCMQGSRTARQLDSVVLPSDKKQKLLGDIDEFLCSGTRRFYLSHGIPYRRSYLFHGVPGTGKTSLIQALAGRHERNVCIVQPTDPAFTDDMLKSAVSNAPARSIIVLEDIDALFTRCRQNRGKSAVTFTGLLNALDGVGTPEGLLFMMTTNFRDQLDDALVRDGRVDYHVRFDYACDEVAREMYEQFYPQTRGGTHSARFVQALRDALKGTDAALTPAALQQFFVVRRKLDAEQAVSAAAGVAAHLKERAPSPPSSPALGPAPDADTAGTGEEGEAAATIPTSEEAGVQTEGSWCERSSGDSCRRKRSQITAPWSLPTVASVVFFAAAAAAAAAALR